MRLVASGACEEANAAIGVAISFGGFDNETFATVSSLQNDLFDLQSDLGSAMTGAPDEELHVTDAHIERLERACEHYSADLVSTDGSVLPAGTVSAALLFQARTIARRAERDTWAAIEQFGNDVNPLTGRYLNRLSSLLFVLARMANFEHGDSVWRPGNSVAPAPAAASASASA